MRKVVETHNHPVSHNVIGHSIARKPTATEKERIRTLGEQGVPPKAILSVLRSEFQNERTSAGEIYNELSAARMDMLAGRTPIEALLELVSQDDYVSRVKLDCVTTECIFFSHRDSVELCRTYSTVFLMDCTYKTNKFKMPLLNIVGITCTNQKFNAGFAFMHEEKEETYTWVLTQFAAESVTPLVICTDRELALMNSISLVFPECKNLICIWHINKNVLANCKKYFDNDSWKEFMSNWYSIVYSHTLDSFAESLQAFEHLYSQTHSAVWDYLNVTWLPHKEKFVGCYINQFPHFGSSSTSRVEGNHHVIKSYVRLGKLDLFVVLKRLSLMLVRSAYRC